MTASQRAIAHIHAAAKEAGISHGHLHEWAGAQGYATLKAMPDDELDTMARQIKADPDTMGAWFDAFEPDEWEVMDVAENAEPGDVSVLSHLFSKEQEAALKAETDEIQRRYRWTA